ncbi:MAG: FHA domain-containing protein [Lachnospiraceae bacterium]|nr:FHA domain-containing protein [Lachnospiraceae bacterium]
MKNKLSLKKYFVIWGVAIGIRLIMYIYAGSDLDNFIYNYPYYKCIEVITTIVVVALDIIAIKKCITTVVELCPGNKKKSSACGVIFLTGITLGVYGGFWLKSQLKRIENRCNELGKQVNVKKTLYIYILWAIFNNVSIFYPQSVQQTVETAEDFSDYFMTLITAGIIAWGLFVILVVLYASNINDLIDADNNYKESVKKQAAEKVEKNVEEIGSHEELKQQDNEKEEKTENQEEPQKNEETDHNQDSEKTEKNRRVKVLEPVTQIDYSLWHYSLLGLEGEYAGMDIPLEPDDFVMLGRNAGTVNIVFKHASVSGLHCQVRYSVDDDCFQVADFSSYGTFVDDVRVEKGELKECQPGAILDLGRTGNRFRLVAERHI